MRIFGLTLISVITAFYSSFACALQVPGPLVETEWLAEHKDDVVILDVRSDEKSFSASPVFRKDKQTGKQVLMRVGGHIPGAHFVDYGGVRSEKKIDGKVKPPEDPR